MAFSWMIGVNFLFIYFFKNISSLSVKLFSRCREGFWKKMSSFLIKKEKKRKKDNDIFECFECCSIPLPLKLDFIQIVLAPRALLIFPFSVCSYLLACRLWWCQGSTCFCWGGPMSSLLKCHHELHGGTDWEGAAVPSVALGSGVCDNSLWRGRRWQGRGV